MNSTSQPEKIMISNMVCQRCITSVEQVLKEMSVPYIHVGLGEAVLGTTLNEAQRQQLETRLRLLGFELVQSRINQMILRIKQAVLEYIQLGSDAHRMKLSAFITQKIPNDYSYISDVFSSVEGKTIEQYFIHQRIEKVKELLVYDQMSLTNIAFETGFSSVHHLSAQFRKVTGLTPTHFRKIGASRRRALDQL